MSKVCNGWDDKNKLSDDGKVALDSLEKNFIEEEKLGKLSPKKIWQMINKGLFDEQATTKDAIREKIGGKAGERIIMMLGLSKGGTAVGNVEYEMAHNEIYLGLSRREQKMLDRIVQSRRIDQIDKNLKVVARSYLDDRAVGTVFDSSVANHVEKLKQEFGEDRLKKLKTLKDKKYITIRKQTSKPDSDVAITYHASKEKAEEHAKRDMEKVLTDAEILHPDGTKGEQYRALLDDYKKIDPENFKKLNDKADLYFARMKRQLGFLRREGLISQKKFDNLKKVGDYSPRRYQQFIDPDIQNDPLQSLTTGSTKRLMQDSALLMKDYMIKLHAKLARNRANVELYNYAKENPGNGVAEIVSADADVAANFKTVTAIVDGEKFRIKMPIEYGKEWGAIDATLDGNIAKIGRWLSASSIVRAQATGYNPEFALTNFPRDVFYSWQTTKEYKSSILPWAAPLQMAQRLAGTAKDVWNWQDVPTGKANEYLRDGGMMPFMTAQGLWLEKVGTKVPLFRGALSKPLRFGEKFLAYAGTKTELWVRLALRDQAIKNRVDKATWKKYEAWTKAGSKGQSPIPVEISREATWIARSYLDFSQGGNLSKIGDIGVPYLNAGLQATRGMFRALTGGNAKGKQRAKNTMIAWWKMSQFIVLYHSVLMLNLYMYPDDLEKTDETDRERNLLFFTPITRETKGGTTRAYLKLPLDQIQAAFANIVGLMTSTHMRENMEFPKDSVWHRYANQDPAMFLEGAKNLVPFTDFLPPTLKAWLNFKNLDTFRGRSIFTGEDQWDKGTEQNPWTHPVLAMSVEKLNDLMPDFGGAIGKPFSPERMKLVLQNFFIPSNSLVRLGGMGADWYADKYITDDLKKEINSRMEEDLRQKIKRFPGVDRVLEFTHTESVDKRKDAEVIKMKEASRVRAAENKVKAAIFDIYNLPKGDIEGQKLAVKRAVDAVDSSDLLRAEKKRLKESIINAKIIKNTGDVKMYRFWQTVAGTSNPHSRALIVFRRWENNPNERDQIINEFNSIKRISNDKTRTELTGMISKFNRGEEVE